MVGVRARVELEIVSVLPNGGLQSERRAVAGGMEAAGDVQKFAVELGRLGDEGDPRVVLDVEEIGRAQMLVAELVAGVEAGGVDRQFDRGSWRKSSVPS